MSTRLRSIFRSLKAKILPESHLRHTGTRPDPPEHGCSQTSLLKWKHKLSKLKGLFKRKKPDASIQSPTVNPMDDVHSVSPEHGIIPERAVDQPLPILPSIVVSAPVVELPSHSTNSDPPSDQPNISKLVTADADFEGAAGAINNMNTPICLTSLLEALSKFNSIVNNIAAIHPFAHAAWSVLSMASKAIIDQAAQDDSVHSLLSKIEDVYTFLVQKELRDIEFMKPVVERICHQTLECSYFIREYSQNNDFRKRLRKNFISETSERIRKYNEVFDELMQQFRDGTIHDTSVVVHPTWESFEDLVQDSDLDSIPYVGEAGLDANKICLEGTRSEILDEITTWINLTEDDVSRVYWLNGSAGSGKSSIAHTIADRFKKLGRLGSCYCLDRSEIAQQREKKVITTMARDLASLDGQIRKELASVIHLDTLLKRTTDVLQQWTEMVVKPARALSESIAGPIVIIIDGLDESGDPKSRARLLRILAGKLGDDENHITKLPPHFRIFLTSRPLPDIYSILNSVHVQSKSMDSIPYLTTQRDIRRYISCQLSDLEGVEIQKVSQDLASASDGLFEWARLACAYIKWDIGEGQTVQELLDRVLVRSKDASVPLLDGMYKITLETIFPEGVSQRSIRLRRFRSVMAQLIKTLEPLPLTSLTSMRRHFSNQELQKIDVDVIVKPLGALLSGTIDPSAVVRPLHASFPEFLANKNRSGEFFVSDLDVDSDIAFACLGVMEDELQFNMCKLPSSYLPNSEVLDLDERIKENISPTLSYSCQFWAHHLQGTQFNFVLAETVRVFLHHERLLFWLEVMSLLKKISSCFGLLSDVIHWVLSHAECKDIVDTTADIQRFIRTFGGPVSFSTPHLYVSAIPFSPKNSHISKRFAGKIGKVLRIAKGHNEAWPVIQGVLHGHHNVVNSVAFSPDGRHTVSGSVDKTIRLWDAETGGLVRPPLEGHEDSVNSVAFSPDGKRLVSGSFDKTIRLWDTETGELIRPPLEGHEDSVNSVAFSPDGKHIVSGSVDNTVRLWDAETGELVRPPLEGHEDWVSSVAFSPDGNHIISGSDDMTIRLWDAETGELIRPPLEGHEDYINSVAFSLDGKYIVSGSVDNTIRLWDAETGELVRPPLEGHEDSVSSVAVSPDGKHIVSGSRDNTIQLWDAETGELLRPPLEGHKEWINSVAFSPDGKRIVSGSFDKTIRLWDAEMGEFFRPPLEGHEDSIYSVAFSPDGKCIVSGSVDNTIRLWDAETGELVRPPLEGHEDSVNSVAFSPDGKHIVSGSVDNTVRLWDAETGELVRPPLEGHEDWVWTVAFSPDGKCIVSGSSDKTVRLWDAETGELVRPPLAGHEHLVSSVAFSPDGKYIVSGSVDDTIRLWDAETGELVRPPLEGHKACVWSVAFSPDGNHIVSGSDDMTIRLWDVKTGQLIQPPLEGHEGCIYSVAFSPDGKHIVSGSFDKTVRLWDIETGELIQPLEGHENCVRSVTFSPDGKHIVSGSDDKAIQLWDIGGAGDFVQPHLKGQHTIKFSRQPEHFLIVSIKPSDLAFSPFYCERNSGKASDDGWVHIGPTSNLLFWTPPTPQFQQYHPGLSIIIPEPV